MNNFHINQRVVCLVKSWSHSSWKQVGVLPRYNGIYTIRAIGIETYSDVGKHVGLLFNEIVNPPVEFSNAPPFPHEFMFPADYFRPVVERKTDISIFTKMLTPNKLELT